MKPWQQAFCNVENILILIKIVIFSQLFIMVTMAIKVGMQLHVYSCNHEKQGPVHLAPQGAMSGDTLMVH